MEEHRAVRKPLKVMSPPSMATAGRTRVAISSLMTSTVSAVGLVEELVAGVHRGVAVVDHRLAGEEVLHDGAEDRPA